MKNKNSGGNEKVIIWSIVTILVLATVGIIYLGSRSAGTSHFTATVAPAITTTDWTEGPKDAKVTLIEYGDFQCPACGAYYPVVKQILSAYGDKILFVFRNFPLTQVHEDAQIAAQAAEAAGLEGKYWEMHAQLYETQRTWSTASPDTVVKDYFDGYAQSLGLNVDKFNQDIISDPVKNKIQADIAGGNAAAIDHTPTFFVNFTQIPNPTSYDKFRSALDNALDVTSAPGSAASIEVRATSTQQ